MWKICIGCGKKWNGGEITGTLCLTCFIDFLENKIKVLEAKNDPNNRLPFIRKLLTKKLIERQEEDIK